MKTIIHVNQHKLRANTKNGTNEPVLTVKDYKSNRYASEAVILGVPSAQSAVLWRTLLDRDPGEGGNAVMGRDSLRESRT